MLIGSITTAAWLVKPLIGYIVDNFLNKKTWVFIALASDIISVLFLGFFKFPIVTLVTLLLINSTNTAFRDVAVDGIMCVEGKKHQITGKIQSIQWMSISASGLITGIAGGYIAEKWDYKLGFLCLIIFYALVGIAAFFYTEIEGKCVPSISPRPSFTAEMKKLFGDKRLLIVGLFIFLYKYSPSFGTPLFFIQRDTFKWSKIFIGVMGTLGTVFEIGGALLYFKFSQRINIKKWLFISVFLGALTSLSYLFYTPVSAIVYNVAYSFIGMFIFLLIMDFMARSTTKGLEATSFALLTSMSNLALVTSNLSGAYLLPKVGLKWLIVLSSLTSLLCLFLINKINYTPQETKPALQNGHE